MRRGSRCDTGLAMRRSSRCVEWSSDVSSPPPNKELLQSRMSSLGRYAGAEAGRAAEFRDVRLPPDDLGAPCSGRAR